MLPCGGCNERWSDFAENVDDTIPLARLFDEETSTSMIEEDTLVIGIVRTAQLTADLRWNSVTQV